MSHRAHSPSFSSFKLSNVRRTHAPKPTHHEWQAADRSEQLRQIVTVTALAAVFAAGLALIVLGFSR
jgi:type VI protein secretion system component VasF